MVASEENLIFAVVIITITYTILAGFIFMIFRRNYKAKAGKEKELRKAVFQAQENERTRIANDLHDHIGGILSSVKVQNEMIRNYTDASVVRPFADKNAGLIDRVVNDIRTIVRNQASQFIINNGLKHELQQLCDQHFMLHKIKISLDFNHEGIIFKDDFAINLFRIFQELLHNTVKHAACTEVVIRMYVSNGMFHAYYSDNGKGFGNGSDSKSGMGMKNVDARIKLFEGTSEFKSVPGVETSYTFSFKTKDIYGDKKPS